MVPPRDFVLGAAAALLVTFLAMALQWSWPGAFGFGATVVWTGMRLVADRLDDFRDAFGNPATSPTQHAQMLLGGAAVFALSLLAP